MITNVPIPEPLRTRLKELCRSINTMPRKELPAFMSAESKKPDWPEVVKCITSVQYDDDFRAIRQEVEQELKT